MITHVFLLPSPSLYKGVHTYDLNSDMEYPVVILCVIPPTYYHIMIIDYTAVFQARYHQLQDAKSTHIGTA